ncbi:MAG: MATE family efflux transporter [Gemmataceae bacterium]|nr:MATE family efflux transporter [Gemmataceae bacterium]
MKVQDGADRGRAGARELGALALPLVLSQSFATLQVTVDRVLLSRHDPREVAAAFPAMMIFWLALGLGQGTVGYVTTFVAQYWGAGRPERVGIAVGQGLSLALLGGLVFPLLEPVLEAAAWWGAAEEDVWELERVYLRYLSYAALPMLVVAAVSGYFSGLGRTWVVLGMDLAGTVVNAVLGWVLIFGRWGFAEMGIAGAGVSTVVGAWVSAGVGLAWMLRKAERQRFGTGRCWQVEPDVLLRLLRYGFPAGVQLFLDALAFTIFTLLVGRLGVAAMAATSVAVTLNMLAFLPMLGLGQAVGILVGQRLGANQPQQAEAVVWLGLRWMLAYMGLIATLYVTCPTLLVAAFAPAEETAAARFAEAAHLVPGLLLGVALYSLADAANVTFAAALRGAGDTRFVAGVTFGLAWPVMVLPTASIVLQSQQWQQKGLGEPLYAPWASATLYIILMALCLWARFAAGLWKQMRVIEPGPEAPRR